VATQITDHTTQALDRLCQQFKDRPNVIALVTALAGTVQAVETALWQLLTERTVAAAVGVHLDALGTIVGQARGGLVDEDYRRFIRARIATNRSRGTIADVLRIADLVLNDATAGLVVDNQGAAAYVLRVASVATADALAEVLVDFLRDATAAGVRVILEYNETTTPLIWGASNWEGAHVWSRAID
jgi:hypothetical protein